MSIDGWSEVLSAVSKKYGLSLRKEVALKATLRNQWDCHPLGAPAIYVGQLIGDPNTTWDLESWRPATNNLATWIGRRCNW